MSNAFGSHDELQVGDRRCDFHRLAAVGDVSRLPYSLKVLLENVLRQHAEGTVAAEDVAALAAWDGTTAAAQRELSFRPARVLMQDFTGVPAVVDLAAMRDAMEDMGGRADSVAPFTPVDLVVDHSIIAEVAGRPDAYRRNVEIEFDRNQERYRFLRWGQQAFDDFRVVPPNTGIVHQVNLEHLADVVTIRDGMAVPDTLVGTDSHTPMVNGLGVLGWGVGGIEAEAAMLGQPVSMLVPEVVGFRLEGELPEGTTATDLVLTVTEMLRQHGVVGRFVEFYGDAVAQVPLANRATIGNMSPEYGSTVTIFPIDGETLRYLEFTGRSPEQVALVEAYAKAQGLFHDPAAPEAAYSDKLVLDLSTVEPSIAGPARPQDRVALSAARRAFHHALRAHVPDHAGPRGPARRSGTPTQDLPSFVEKDSPDVGSALSFPASDVPLSHDNGSDRPHEVGPDDIEPPHERVTVELADGTGVELDHGHVVIAAITSCTNTSNPQVMLAAGLLARNAAERGLASKPWVKTSLAPGSQVVTDYYERAGLVPALEKLGFHLVGYGCTTCIGNSGPIAPEISRAIAEHDLAMCSVLSGNRNFEGRINPDVRMNYLASPPLVIAYALAGTLDIDLTRDPLGTDHHGEPVYLADIWPSTAEVQATIRDAIEPEMFRRRYADVFTGDERWRSLEVPTGGRFAWDDESTYVQRPPFFDGMRREPEPPRDIHGARVLAVLGDSVTTDHISPAGVIKADSPAGRYLTDHGVEPGDFNSYGSRRGNHEVMIRGTFANIRLRNQLVPGVEGGFTLHLPSEEQLPVYDAAMRYADDGVPLVVLAGAEYGSGSSRDWAAKGTALLGVRAVIAAGYERIHRSNLLQMGVLPLQFTDGDSIESLGLTGHETFEVVGIDEVDVGSAVTVDADGTRFTTAVRIDTPQEVAYYRHGGILRYVLRRLLSEA